MSNIFKQGCVWMVSLSLIALGTPAVSRANIIATPTVVQAAQRDANLANIRSALDRNEVRERLMSMGVSPGQVDARLNVLSDAELERLSQQIDQAPAAGSLLAVVGLVFVVLIVLELVGAIDIFKKH